jgi:regulator of replication initiation timing
MNEKLKEHYLKVLEQNSELKLENEKLKGDAMTMALRLLGEDENTFSPECYEVMERWKKICLHYINMKSGE